MAFSNALSNQWYFISPERNSPSNRLRNHIIPNYRADKWEGNKRKIIL